MLGDGAVVSHERPFGWLLAFDVPFREAPLTARTAGGWLALLVFRAAVPAQVIHSPLSILGRPELH